MRRIEERLIEQSEEPDHPPVGTGLDGIAGALGLLAEAERLVAAGAGHGREQQRHGVVAEDPIRPELPRRPFAGTVQTPSDAGHLLDRPRPGHLGFRRGQRLVALTDALQELGCECVAGRKLRRRPVPPRISLETGQMVFRPAEQMAAQFSVRNSRRT